MQSESVGYFQPQQAREVAAAFEKHDVDYMFIGKSAAILLGYPASTQDVDIYAKVSTENGKRIVAALSELGFEISDQAESEIIRGKDFVELKSGPFDIDIIFAPDGIDDYESAKKRMVFVDNFPIANLRDIIASKIAASREKDKNDLPLLEDFRISFEKRQMRDLELHSK